MIDFVGWITVILRAFSAAGIIALIVWQIKLLKPPVRNQWIRYVMIGLMLIMLTNYAQSLVLNFYRQPDGNLLKAARHFSQLASSTSGLVSVLLVAVLFLRKLEK